MLKMDSAKRSILPIQFIVMVCFLTLSLSLSRAGVTLTIGDGSGSPGSADRMVEVGLVNSNNVAGAVQVDVCDVDYYLEPGIPACELTERTTGYDCSTFEQVNGCLRVIVTSNELDEQGDPYVIGEGEGAIFTLRYNVSGGAPLGECRDLNPENELVADEGGNGLDVTLASGLFCFDSSLTTTTTTISTTTTTSSATTTVPGSTTTTTAAGPAYEVSISPTSATLDSDASLQFSARTTSHGQEAGGTYTWEIVPESTIGSIIDGNGLFAAGTNNTQSAIEETVRVTDTAHENKSATATVTVKVKEEPPPECEVTINPSAATVPSGGALTLLAAGNGDCNASQNEWSIDTDIASVVDQEGDYTAGSNTTGSQATDVITVVDHANSDISSSATIHVENEESVKNASVVPVRLLGSRWIPLPYMLLILGEDTNFNLKSNVSFEPGEDILKLFQFGFGKVMFVTVLLDANPQEGAVNVIITTAGEVAAGKITIGLLPLIFNEDYSGRAGLNVEISCDDFSLSDTFDRGRSQL